MLGEHKTQQTWVALTKKVMHSLSKKGIFLDAGDDLSHQVVLLVNAHFQQPDYFQQRFEADLVILL